MDRGYIKLWRKSIDSGWLSNHILWCFWCWCLLKATHKPIEQIIGFQTIHLEPGEFIFGRNKAAKELRASPQQIRTCLNSLKKMENLTIKSTNKFSIISIINWDIYQQDKMQINQQINKPLTSKQPATNHKQEHKNKRKEIIYPDDFETFWKEYPKHVKKIVAFAEWKKIDTSNGTLQKIMNGIKDWKNSQQWNDNDGKYIPDPERFLKNRRWEDEIKKINIQQQSLMPRN